VDVWDSKMASKTVRYVYVSSLYLVKVTVQDFIEMLLLSL
jgi:hypothetical protein